MIRMKAKEIYVNASDSRDGEDFAASAGWIDRFLERNNFSVRRRTTVAQKDGGYVTNSSAQPEWKQEVRVVCH